MNNSSFSFDEPLTLSRMAVLARLMHEARAIAHAAGIRVPAELAGDALRVASRALREAAGR